MTSNPNADERVVPAHSGIKRLQHSVATFVGVDATHRHETVVAMLENNAQRAPGYWIQLFLSLGIATLGLVLNSTAVVIGAMLVSPLMGPILELGMGLAVGSSLLTIRASIRVILSIALVIAGATLLVLVFPFHEVTNEVSSRTSPTALDLLVAIFCALTAAYTTVRSSTETTSAAAGTAIGIALVPPLCTVGFGLGTDSRVIAGGAAMLFTANLSAIVVFSVFAFLLLGFNQVNAAQLELEFVEKDTRIGHLAGWTHATLAKLFGSRYGLATRVLMPAVLFALVFIPLRRALNEVTWEVRTRGAIKSILDAEVKDALQTNVTVAHHTVSVSVLTVGTGSNGIAAQKRIAAKLTDATGVVPNVSVVEVADASSVAKMLSPQSPGVQLLAKPKAVPALHDAVATALAATWPPIAGSVIDWTLDIATHDSVTLQLSYLGTELSPSAVALLSSGLSQQVGSPVRILPHALSPESLTALPRKSREWLDSALVLLAIVARADSATACIAGPIKPSGTMRAFDRVISDSLHASHAAAMHRAQFAEGKDWSLRIGRDSCTAAHDAVPAQR